ncbi:MAG: prepilin-type N-terminal cleavage/methylation domain-containing protein [Actinobacteria bacterium]|nr:MAG: prepilin-type N-terminal cleavage/methylation domain-containing protein [Actinomycetota bacterium]
MVTMAPSMRREDGFTLTELLVVLGLLSVILGAAWLGFQVANNGSKASDRQSYISHEVGFPLDYMERILIQNYGFDNTYPGTTGYRVAALTDRDNDGHPEKYIFEATSAGVLQVTTSEEVDRPTPKVYVISEHNSNVAQTKVLFKYFDANLNEITNMGNVDSQARSMSMTIVTTYDGQSFSDTRRVFFRNR